VPWLAGGKNFALTIRILFAYYWECLESRLRSDMIRETLCGSQGDAGARNEACSLSIPGDFATMNADIWVRGDLVRIVKQIRPCFQGRYD